MGDSTAMTIEFLRARLLSERSVSRAARQRADQLAKRVVELEEQLRLVSVQRKKAEKAAAEVLAILESQGIDDLSDTINSGSDQEELLCDDTVKEFESSATSRMDRSIVEDGLSGSEAEVSNSQDLKQMERQTSQLIFMPREIERLLALIFCNNQLKGSMETSKGMMEEVGAESPQVDDHNRQTEIHHYATGRERDEVMERILEQQTKLIGQFQAEENAQTEWENKYNENMTSQADYKLGNHQSCIAENSNHARKEITEFADRTPDYDQAANLRDAHISNSEEPTSESLSGSENNNGSKEASNVALSNSSTPRDIISAPIGCCSDTRGKDFMDHQYDGMSMAIQETKTISHKHAVLAPECYGTGNGIHEDPSSRTSFPIDYQNKLQKLSQQKDQMQLARQLPRTTSSSLGGVLEALQRAKLSLSQQLVKLPSTSQNMLAIAAPSQIRAVSPVNGLDIPISSASLFRLPTDSFPPSHFSGPKLYYSESTFPANRHENPSSNPRVEGGSRVIPDAEYHFDSHANSSMGIYDPNRYFRACSVVPPERASFCNDFSKSHSDARNGVPSGDRYSLYGGDCTGSDMRML